MTPSLLIGLMSGTSLDGLDAVLCEYTPSELSTPAIPRLIAQRCEPLPAALRQELLALTQPGANEIERLGAADVALGRFQADVVNRLLADAGTNARQIRAIGSHGQTIRHRPLLPEPFTLQIGDPHILAEQTGITVIADFRRRDIAAGGEGAPLAPGFHAACLRSPDQDRVIVNIGGMANITLLSRDSQAPVIGYDTGPGNVLMDGWIQETLQQPYDKDGAWATTGCVDSALFERLHDHPYFSQPFPKSTGREAFNPDWLKRQLLQLSPQPAPQDIQATLLELTGRTIAEAINQHNLPQAHIYLCGGGAYNGALKQRLQTLLPDASVADTGALGIAPEWLEATAFAWLAQQCLDGMAGNRAEVTGAKGPRVLGAIYQAG